jgi:hypothetical protein
MDPRQGERLLHRAGRHGQISRPGRARGRRRRGRAPGPVLHRRRARRDPLPGPGRQLRRPRHREPAPQRPDHLRRTRVRAPGRHRSPAAIPVRRPRLRTPRTGNRITLAVRIPGPVPARAHHRRQHARPAAPPLPRRGHQRRPPPDETSPRERSCQSQNQLKHPRGTGTFNWPPAGTSTWPLT